MPLGRKVGLDPSNIVLHGEPATLSKKEHRPGHIVLDGDPTPPQKRGTAPTNFRPMSVVAKRPPISATAEHLLHHYTKGITRHSGNMLRVWGLCFPQGPGAELLVSGVWGEAPEAESFLLHK